VAADFENESDTPTSRFAAVAVIRRLREHGHVAYLAGGCVRDRLLGIEPQDHDVATDAEPAVVQGLFRRTRAVGEAFGVVLVYAPGSAGPAPRFLPIEVATFRTEGVYADGRRPDAVQYTDAQHDAERRDFTVNGLFEDPHGQVSGSDSTPTDAATRTLPDGGVVIDYVGGLADVAARVLRAIGEPERRFAEDYLRMLRAVRFTARLGFRLDPATAAAIRRHAPKLVGISRERIGQEVRAMLSGPRPADAAELLQALHLDGPALDQPHREGDCPTLRSLGAGPAYPAALVAWLLDRCPTEEPLPYGAALAGVGRALRGPLNLSNDELGSIGRVADHLERASRWATLGVAQRKRLLSAADWDMAWAVLRARGEAGAIEAEAPGLGGDGVGLAPPPLLDGHALIRAGLRPGPGFRALLDAAYDEQLEGRLRDAEAALAWVRAEAAERDGE
jgi:hypothetical protein